MMLRKTSLVSFRAWLNRSKAWYTSGFVVTGALFLIKLLLLRMFFYGSVQWGSGGLAGEWLTTLGLLCLVELLTPLKARQGVYWTLNAVFSFLLFSSVLYFAHFGTVPTYAVLSGLNQVPQVRASVETLLRPEQFLFFVDLLMLGLWKLILAFFPRRLKFQHNLESNIERKQQRADSLGAECTSLKQQEPAVKVRRLSWSTVMVMLLALCVGVSALYVQRGRNISNELVRAEKIGFLNYQIVAAIQQREEDKMIAEGHIETTRAEIAKLQSSYPYRVPVNLAESEEEEALPAGERSPHFYGIARGMNLIVIQLESFQRFPLELKLDNGEEITPVLNGLIRDGIYFPNVYQQIGQGNTSDAEFIFNTSIYPTAAVAMSTGYGDRELPSLPRLLQKYGYNASTYHVNQVTFWDRNLLYPALNFNQYYDKQAFENDHFNDYGASDEEMYRVGLEHMIDLDARNKLFYKQFITTSSHSPFIVPERFRQLSIPEPLAGTNLGNYLTAVNYTDYAIGKLIEGLKEAGLWEKTMLVIYGDHFGIQPHETGAEEIEAQLGIPYHNTISRFNIPFIIHVPQKQLGLVSARVGGQVDMLPTVANLLGISLKGENFTALGQDLLNIKRNILGVRYYLPTGSFFNDEVLYVPGEGFDDGQAVSLRTFEPLEDIEHLRDDYEYILSLMKLSDEYVKLLPKRQK